MYLVQVACCLGGGSAGGREGGGGGGIGQHQLMLRLPPFQHSTEHAAEQVACCCRSTPTPPATRGLGDKEAMAAGGRLVKSVAVISIADKDLPGLVGAWSGC